MDVPYGRIIAFIGFYHPGSTGVHPTQYTSNLVRGCTEIRRLGLRRLPRGAISRHLAERTYLRRLLKSWL